MKGIRFVNAEDFLKCTGELWAHLTFDDNYRSWHEALALFDELDVRATFYVNTHYFRDRASPGEIKDFYDCLEYEGERVPLTTSELLNSTQPSTPSARIRIRTECLASLPLEEAKREIRLSKEVLKDQFIFTAAFPDTRLLVYSRCLYR